MISESHISILILIHASLGTIALCAGIPAMASKKGSTLHKKSGKIFFYSLLSSALLALLISCLPNHNSPFLFAIGVFSIYLCVGGFRAVRYKKKSPSLFNDKLLAFLMISTGLAMIVYPIIIHHKINIVLSVFGLIGGMLALQDLRNFKQKESLRKKWLGIHLGKMTGAYIASFTAFIVVNGWIPGIYGWLTPSFFGTLFIIYQTRKLKA